MGDPMEATQAHPPKLNASRTPRQELTLALLADSWAFRYSVI